MLKNQQRKDKMLESMKKEISEDIKKVYESGKMTNAEIKTVVENAVSKVIDNSKDGLLEINEIAKTAVIATISELKSADGANRAHIQAMVDGIVHGMSKKSKESIDKIDIELLKTKYRLQEEKERLNLQLKDTLDGAKEAALDFSQEIKSDIEDVVTETKLKSIEALGLMREIIRHSVKTIIDEGVDVEEKITQVTKEAVDNALNAGKLSAQKAKEVSQEAILAAIQTAEEAQKDIEKTTKSAVSGAKQSIIQIVDKTKASFKEAGEMTVDLMEEDVRHTLEDLQIMEEFFVEALGNVANRVDETANKVLQESIREIKKTNTQMKESVEEAADEALQYLKEKGSSFAYATKEKAKEIAEDVKEEVVVLSERMLAVTKGALSGMIDGAKKAMKKDEGK